MAEEPTIEAAAETEQPSDPEPEAETAPARLPDDHPLVKAYQATKDELAKAKARVKEFEDASKTETEKLAEKIAELQKALADKEKALEEAQIDKLRAVVAAERGLTEKQAARLQGATLEELQADADELFGPKAGDGAKMPRQPTPDLKGGSDPTTDVEVDVKKIFDSIKL